MFLVEKQISLCEFSALTCKVFVFLAVRAGLGLGWQGLDDENISLLDLLSGPKFVFCAVILNLNYASCCLPKFKEISTSLSILSTLLLSTIHRRYFSYPAGQQTDDAFCLVDIKHIRA